ncbi:hypothetical protein OS189_01840 [Sulfitobacter sp. F26169L]|uniref:hypothetical protein n=1 Tax=Sulfitobacter sp. F26169L TaxID=2996015 RepID=UPI002260B3A8|nr:hypothetical protein [Sulfitobacter sp. F26169L]MCX7565083.1 hypothetical protein [Sulfitobacter sp. F26169L]
MKFGITGREPRGDKGITKQLFELVWRVIPDENYLLGKNRTTCTEGGSGTEIRQAEKLRYVMDAAISEISGRLKERSLAYFCSKVRWYIACLPQGRKQDVL